MIHVEAGIVATNYPRLLERIYRERGLRDLVMPSVWAAVCLAGIGLVWLYAAVRPRLGPGPGTALKVGIVVGLFMGVPDNVANAAWGLSGGYLPTMWMIEHVVGCALGTLVGAWFYREAA